MTFPTERPAPPTWQDRAFALERFLWDHKRWPVRSRQSEAVLAAWVESQRDAAAPARTTNRLSQDRRAWLDVHAPGWDAADNPSAFHRNVHRLAAYRARHGHFPDGGPHDDADDLVAAEFYLAVRQARARRMLAPAQTRTLNVVVPGWDAAPDPVARAEAAPLADARLLPALATLYVAQARAAA